MTRSRNKGGAGQGPPRPSSAASILGGPAPSSARRVFGATPSSSRPTAAPSSTPSTSSAAPAARPKETQSDNGRRFGSAAQTQRPTPRPSAPSPAPPPAAQEESPRAFGELVLWNRNQGWGFIVAEDPPGKKTFAHKNDFAFQFTDDTAPPVGSRVSFVFGFDPKSGRERATEVEIESLGPSAPSSSSAAEAPAGPGKSGSAPPTTAAAATAAAPGRADAAEGSGTSAVTVGPLIKGPSQALEVQGRNRLHEEGSVDVLNGELAGLCEKYREAKNPVVIADFDVSQNKLPVAGFESLLTTVEIAGVRVKTFRMFGCPTFDDEVAEHVANYLRQATEDTVPYELHMSDCAITTLGFNSIMEAIEDNSVFPRPSQKGDGFVPIFLRLEHNYISPEAMQKKVDEGIIRPLRRDIFQQRKGKPDDQAIKVHLLVGKGKSAGGIDFIQKDGEPPDPANAPPPKPVDDKFSKEQKQREAAVKAKARPQQPGPPSMPPSMPGMNPGMQMMLQRANPKLRQAFMQTMRTFMNTMQARRQAQAQNVANMTLNKMAQAGNAAGKKAKVPQQALGRIPRTPPQGAGGAAKPSAGGGGKAKPPAAPRSAAAAKARGTGGSQYGRVAGPGGPGPAPGPTRSAARAAQHAGANGSAPQQRPQTKKPGGVSRPSGSMPPVPKSAGQAARQAMMNPFARGMPPAGKGMPPVPKAAAAFSLFGNNKRKASEISQAPSSAKGQPFRASAGLRDAEEARGKHRDRKRHRRSDGPSGAGGDLPQPWERHFSEDHKMPYYWNSVTGDTQWEKPRS